MLPHCGDDLLGLRGLDAHIVGALPDQQRPHDTIRAIERRTLLEHAQEMAAHESPRTTKLYDRTKERLTQDEVEWIRF